MFGNLRISYTGITNYLEGAHKFKNTVSFYGIYLLEISKGNNDVFMCVFSVFFFYDWMVLTCLNRNSFLSYTTYKNILKNSTICTTYIFLSDIIVTSITSSFTSTTFDKILEMPLIHRIVFFTIYSLILSAFCVPVGLGYVNGGEKFRTLQVPVGPVAGPILNGTVESRETYVDSLFNNLRVPGLLDKERLETFELNDESRMYLSHIMFHYDQLMGLRLPFDSLGKFYMIPTPILRNIIDPNIPLETDDIVGNIQFRYLPIPEHIDALITAPDLPKITLLRMGDDGLPRIDLDRFLKASKRDYGRGDYECFLSKDIPVLANHLAWIMARFYLGNKDEDQQREMRKFIDGTWVEFSRKILKDHVLHLQLVKLGAQEGKLPRDCDLDPSMYLCDHDSGLYVPSNPGAPDLDLDIDNMLDRSWDSIKNVLSYDHGPLQLLSLFYTKLFDKGLTPRGGKGKGINDEVKVRDNLERTLVYLRNRNGTPSTKDGNDSVSKDEVSNQEDIDTMDLGRSIQSNSEEFFLKGKMRELNNNAPNNDQSWMNLGMTSAAIGSVGSIGLGGLITYRSNIKLKTTIKDLKKNTEKKINKTKKVLKILKTQHDTTLKTLQTEYVTLAQHKTTQEEHNKTQKKLSETSGELETLKTQHGTTCNELKTLQQEHGKTQDELKALKKQNHDLQSNLQTQNDTTQEKLRVLQQEHKDELEALKKQNHDLQTQNDSLQKDLKNINMILQELQERDRGREKIIQELQERDREREKIIQELQENNNSLLTRLNEIKAENSIILTENNALKEDNKRLRENLENLDDQSSSNSSDDKYDDKKGNGRFNDDPYGDSYQGRSYIQTQDIQLYPLHFKVYNLFGAKLHYLPETNLSIPESAWNILRLVMNDYKRFYQKTKESRIQSNVKEVRGLKHTFKTIEIDYSSSNAHLPHMFDRRFFKAEPGLNKIIFTFRGKASSLIKSKSNVYDHLKGIVEEFKFRNKEINNNHYSKIIERFLLKNVGNCLMRSVSESTYHDKSKLNLNFDNDSNGIDNDSQYTNSLEIKHEEDINNNVSFILENPNNIVSVNSFNNDSDRNNTQHVLTDIRNNSQLSEINNLNLTVSNDTILNSHPHIIDGNNNSSPDLPFLNEDLN